MNGFERKLCGCGCGQAAPIAAKTSARAGNIKGQPQRFVAGHYARVMTPESRAKMSAAHKGKKFSPGHKENMRESKIGDRNPNWLGDDVGYAALHDWLIENFPKARICEECESEGGTDYAFDHRLGKHTRNREDYRELCRSCHTTWDLAIGQRESVFGRVI